MRIIIKNADFDDFNELAKLARQGKINTFCMTDEDEERQKGEWVIFNSYYRKCNKCERMVGFDYADPEHGNWFNFCPNCGASMKSSADMEGSDIQ